MDAPSDTFLARYLAGECSSDELEVLAQWAAGVPARQVWLDNLRTMWQARRAPPAWDVAGMWGAVRGSMRAEHRISAILARPPLFRHVGVRRSRPLMATAAAAAMLVLGLGGVLFIRSRAGTTTHAGVAEAPAREYLTERGRRATLQLADGTRLVLGPASRLRVPLTFGRTTRDVVLEGEALFDVVHDTTRPFRVLARHAVAQDIGTRFAVRAYAEDPVVTVAVAEGAVALGSAGVPSSRVAQGIVLGKGELGTLDSAGRVMTTRGPAVADLLARASGTLVLTDVPLGEAAERLASWYAMDIRLASPSLAARRVTATFTNESPLEALRFLGSFLDLTVAQTKDGFVLRSK